MTTERSLAPGRRAALPTNDGRHSKEAWEVHSQQGAERAPNGGEKLQRRPRSSW